tara:strand:- start:2029 stop:2556 length:528 start_codon:yes stop_codon:yes gene_type:complete
MFLHYFNKKENNDKIIANRIYKYIILYVQNIVKNKDLHIKSNFNTSFELISILIFIIFFSYKKQSGDRKIKQLLMDIYIDDLDKSLREIGIGDMSIGKYVKSYVKKVYYRLNKLENIFQNNDDDAFFKYICKIDIQSKDGQISELSNYLFKFINKLLNNAKKEELSDFKVKIDII